MESFNNFPSSSSFVSTKKRTYEVFLSFRGEDTRTGFVDHLYAALVQRDIDTFKDDEMLRKGEQIPLELLNAIEESRCAVVVFSENYANSSWCLDELVKIMECHKLMGLRVLPVFYHVNPSDLRGQKRNYATAFQQHEEKYRGDLDKVNRWRKALVEASNLSGWHFSNSLNSGEYNFINKIVQDIFHNIKSQGMEDNLIGMECHMDALNSLLDTEETKEVRVIGIWGMGGIGKTTIAKALFRRNVYKFDCSCFVKDVRVNSSREKDICALQKKILKDIQQIPRTKIEIQDRDYGLRLIKKAFSNKKVLLVLDDVDDIKQLEFLAASHKWFGQGSRIIITTRDKHVLVVAHAEYKPNCLLVDQAIELFSRHAFQKNRPPEGYEDLSLRAIQYTGYLPLALKVLGSFFRGREAIVWESALNRLAKEPNIEIFETLKLSFDGLQVSEKQIFLDIACFFKGKEKKHVTRILDSFGFNAMIGISALIEKSLITVSNGKLDMHDLIQEMGSKIVHESFSQSRLWELEDIHDLVNMNGNLEVVQAIVLPRKKYNDDKEQGISADMFRKMINLRLLDVDSAFTSSEPIFLPYKLRWLCWESYPYVSLPVEQMRKLVGLYMCSGSMKHIWEGQPILPNLKFVDVSWSSSLEHFPDISGAANMERLNLSNCSNLTMVHESLGLHRRLVYLNMSGCKYLTRLPSMLEMESLETLILSGCFSLARFPEVSPLMVKLSKMYLDGCSGIEELPSSISHLSGLSLLNLMSCTNIKYIPTSICELRHLKSLYLDNCTKLQEVPEELGSMESLEELLLGLPEMYNHGRLQSLIHFQSLTILYSLRRLDLSWRQIDEESFPRNLGRFFSLEEVYLSGNCKLTHLPAGISQLSHLKLLEVSECSKLRVLNALPSGIQILRARGCVSLEKIEDLSEVHEWLYKIWVFDCDKLLENQENRRYLDKMLEQSFLKKCAAVDHRLSISISGSNVPSWFKEKGYGCNITLKLPPKCHTQIMGFAVCGVFHESWRSKYASPRIIFRIINDEQALPNSDINLYLNPASRKGNIVWITYIPFRFFQQMYHDFQPEDWSHIEGNLAMTIMTADGNTSLECGAHIFSKKYVESVQLSSTLISDYGNLVHVDGDEYQEDREYINTRVASNTYVYEQKVDDKTLNLVTLRNRISRKHIMNRTISMTQAYYECLHAHIGRSMNALPTENTQTSQFEGLSRARDRPRTTDRPRIFERVLSKIIAGLTKVIPKCRK